MDSPRSVGKNTDVHRHEPCLAPRTGCTPPLLLLLVAQLSAPAPTLAPDRPSRPPQARRPPGPRRPPPRPPWAPSCAAPCTPSAPSACSWRCRATGGTSWCTTRRQAGSREGREGGRGLLAEEDLVGEGSTLSSSPEEAAPNPSQTGATGSAALTVDEGDGLGGA